MFSFTKPFALFLQRSYLVSPFLPPKWKMLRVNFYWKLSFLKSVPTSTAFQKVILRPIMGYPFCESAHTHTELLSAGPRSQRVSSFLLLNSTDQRAASSGQLPGGTEGNWNTERVKVKPLLLQLKHKTQIITRLHTSNNNHRAVNETKPHPTVTWAWMRVSHCVDMHLSWTGTGNKVYSRVFADIRCSEIM